MAHACQGSKVGHGDQSSTPHVPNHRRLQKPEILNSTNVIFLSLPTFLIYPLTLCSSSNSTNEPLNVNYNNTITNLFSIRADGDELFEDIY